MSGYDGSKVILEVLDDHVVEDGRENDELRLRSFGFIFFVKDEEGVVIEILSEYPYLLLLMKLCTNDWKNQSERINMKVNEDNVKYGGMMKVRARKVFRLSSNEFWKNIGSLISAPTFGIGGSRLWEKEETQRIIGKKSNRCSIRAKVNLYDIHLFYSIYCLLFYIFINVQIKSLTMFPGALNLLHRHKINLANLS